MTGIKSMADQLRESMKTGSNQDVGKKTVQEKKKVSKVPREVSGLIAEIKKFELTGDDKLLVRLDQRTLFMMKQLKISDGIDMNRLIAYGIQQFFSSNPQLIKYIKENIKTIDL